jgi:ligand-binding SRPBCC domain-containing protein
VLTARVPLAGRHEEHVAKIQVRSELPASVGAVWAALKRPETFLYVTRGVMGAPALKKQLAEGGIDGIRPGLEGAGRIFLFHVLPLHRHSVSVLEVDDETRTIRTTERGGPIRRWDHTLRATAKDGRTTVYEDLVEIEAGRLTAAIAWVARAFYRYRHLRWRRLSRRLQSNPQGEAGR